MTALDAAFARAIAAVVASIDEPSWAFSGAIGPTLAEGIGAGSGGTTRLAEVLT